MKKPFWMKLIICMLTGMILVNGILPTNIVFAKGFKPFVCEETGWYYLTQIQSSTAISFLVEGFGNQGTADIYLEVEGNKQAVESDGQGFVYLQAGNTYSYVDNTNGFYGYDLILCTTDYNDSDSREEIIGTYEEDAVNLLKNEDKASFFENFVTQFFMLVGKVIYAILCIAIREDFSIEKVIFNQYTNIRLAFFTNDVTGAANDNKFISESGIRDVLNNFYEIFTGIAIVVYLIILVYMGIRILLGSTAEKGSKYKEFILYWLEGVLILFLFPYIMKYSIQINNAFVSFLYENKSGYVSIMNAQPEAKPIDSDLENLTSHLSEVEEQLTGSDYMSVMYKKAKNDGWLVYAICWWVMFLQIIGFLLVYFKRVLVTMFLIAIFPLVMISYAIDKIGDAKSQAFDKWIKEFMLNVFVQSFHAITYVLIMSIISMLMNDPSENWILMLIALGFVSKGDDMLRVMFSLDSKAGSVKGIGASFAKTLAMTQAINTVRGIKNSVTNPKGLGMKAYNSAAHLSQKAWNHADDRVSRTSAKLKLDKLQDVPTNPLNGNILADTATKEEIEKDIKESIDILLGKKEGGATNDEIRNAADKLTGYLNMTGNEDVQSIIDNLASNISEVEKQKLDDLLMQNAHINALMVGGREINVRQNIDLILSLLQRDANGDFTPESKAILNKIASSEFELKAMKLFGGGIKFNRDNVVEVDSNRTGRNNRVGNNAYFTEREIKLQQFKGRGKARENRASNKDAKSQLETIIKSNGSTLTTYSSKNTSASKKAKRTVQRTTKPGQERFGQEMQQKANENREQMNGEVKRKSKFKPLKQPKKPWQNVDSVTGSAGLETAKNVAGNTVSKARFKMSPKNVNPAVQTSRAENINNPAMQRLKNEKRQEQLDEKIQNSDSKKAFTPGGGIIDRMRTSDSSKPKTKSNTNQPTNIPNDNQTSSRSSGGNMQNAGADIASRQGTAESLEDILNTSNTQETPIKTPNFSDRDVKNGTNLFNYFAYGDVRGYNAKKNNNPSTHAALSTPKGDADETVNISEQARNELENLGSAISVLTQADGGYYTARELLENITYVRAFVQKHDDMSEDEKFVLDKMINFLDCRPEDYEAYLRVRILNDPDSVGNDKKIIEECKAYVKNTPMLSVIKDKLGYNMEDLVEDKNLKHLNVRNTTYEGIASEEHRARVQEQYERQLEKYELEREIVRLDKKIDENYNFKSYAKDVGNLVVDAAKFGLDMHFSVGVGLGTGLMASGMAVDGKSETLSQATEQIMAGFAAENKIYKGVKEDVSTVYGWGKKGVDAILDTREKKEKTDNNPIKEFSKPKDYNSRVNELKDKTEVKSPLFGKRGKKDDN